MNQPTLCGQALVRRVQLDADLEVWSADTDPRLCLTDRMVAERFGVTPRTALRWRLGQTRILVDEADRYAHLLGYHPVDVWPEWYQVTASMAHTLACGCEACAELAEGRIEARRQHQRAYVDANRELINARRRVGAST